MTLAAAQMESPLLDRVKRTDPQRYRSLVKGRRDYLAAVADGSAPAPGSPAKHICHGCGQWRVIYRGGEQHTELCLACGIKSGRLKREDYPPELLQQEGIE